MFPSSRFLAEAMARQVTKVICRGDTVIELGPGTGAITAWLLRGYIGRRCRSFIAVEKNRGFSRMLRGKYPDQKIIHGDARNLDAYIDPAGGKVVIVSSLPLNSMQRDDVTTIASKCAELLGMRGGYMFQYTYSNQDPFRHAFDFAESQLMEKVYRNLPPATIWRYRVAHQVKFMPELLKALSGGD